MNSGTSTSVGFDRQQTPLQRNDYIYNRNASMPVAEAYKTLRVYRKYFVLWVAGWIFIAIMYLFYARPQFNASTLIILNPSRQIVSNNNSSEGAIPVLDSAQTESQIQVLKSERLLNAVFEALSIINSPEYSTHDDTLSLIPTYLSAGKNPKKTEENAEMRRRLVFQAFTNRVSVKRVGQSYVLEVSYQSFIPQESARVANAISLQYIKSQIALKAASVQRGNEYLQGRIISINNQLKSASEGVASGTIPDMQFPDADAQIISAAVEPLGKTSPKVSLILAISLTFGIVSGLAAIVIRNAFDKTLKFPAQITQRLQVLCFGVLPRFKKRARGLNNPSHRSLRNQFFGGLRTEIYMNAISNGRRTIGVFSWCPGAGCSFVASNIAQTISSVNRSATLIEIDLSSPKKDATRNGDIEYRANDEPTSSEQAKGQSGVLNTISISDFNALNSLKRGSTAQQKDASNWWMYSDNMDIVIDFPSIERHPECLTVCGSIDCAILVVEFGRTSVDQAEKAIHALTNSGVKTIGVVINKAV